MACQRCGNDSSAVDGCNDATFPDGTPAIPYGSEPAYVERWRASPVSGCHDCGARVGGTHHWACDLERCPKCGGQLLFCACWADLLAGNPEAADVEIAGLDAMFKG